jgi:hypothetical protein
MTKEKFRAVLNAEIQRLRNGGACAFNLDCGGEPILCREEAYLYLDEEEGVFEGSTMWNEHDGYFNIEIFPSTAFVREFRYGKTFAEEVDCEIFALNEGEQAIVRDTMERARGRVYHDRRRKKAEK